MEKKDFDAAGASAIHCAPSMLGKAGKASSCTVQWEIYFLVLSNLIVLSLCLAFAGLEFSVLSSDTPRQSSRQSSVMSVFSNRLLDREAFQCSSRIVFEIETIEYLQIHQGSFKYYVSMFLTFFRPTHLISRHQHFHLPTLNMMSAFPHTQPAMYIFAL